MDGEARFGVLPGQGPKEGPSSAPSISASARECPDPSAGMDGVRMLLVPWGPGDTGC